LKLAKTIAMNQRNGEELLWQAVLTKDRSFDGSFVFAVSSTGVYCRPSCPARRPRRENVSFFKSPENAEQAGFRSCRRCHPSDGKASDPQRDLVRRARLLIEQNSEGAIDLASLGQSLGVSSFHLQRTFKSVMGITPRQYAQAHRFRKFKEGIRAGESISGALYDAGFGSSSRLYEKAEAELGMTPAAYKHGGRDMSIKYTVAQSHLGYVMVAATERGICSIRLGDSQAALEDELRQEFTAARIEPDNETLQSWVGIILEHLEGSQPSLDLPLDVQATAFQRQVWEALRAIPYGSTRSYKEVAGALGRPTAFRAVARACATNPVALVIPCHRVIREDQSLGGYRWGLDRKRALLEREKRSERE